MSEYEKVDSLRPPLSLRTKKEERELITRRSTFQRYSVPTFIGCGDLDLDRLDITSLGLYGRDSEKTQLLEACNRVHNAAHVERRSAQGEMGQETARSSELVLISGSSGMGKSALAQSIKSDVERTGCLFVSGKFNMMDHTEPYTAFLTAFNGLCDELLSAINFCEGSLDRTSAVRIQSAIRDTISTDSIILTGVIPKLSLVLNTQEGTDNNNKYAQSTVDETFMVSRNRFNFLLRQFIHAYCSQKTIVMFLDDIQWADAASLELLKVLTSDRNNPNLIVIGSYRDAEVTQEGNHPLSTCLDEIHASDTTTVTNIQLNNLDVDATNGIISHALTMSTDRTHQLARIIHKKTYGNPFAIINFLTSMKDEGYLQYCLTTLTWKWEENKILTHMSATDNVVEMLISKIRKKLPLGIRNVLQIASCLGETFDSSVVAMVLEKNQDLDLFSEAHQDSFIDESNVSAVDSLDVCVNEGLLETAGDLEYRFVHDQVSTACYSLIPEDSQDLIQYKIGEALMENLPASELEKSIFVVVGLLNHGVGLISNNRKKCIHLARLNLQAAIKAINVSAFGSGGIYIKTGIYLLGNDHWTTQKSLALELYNTGAKIEYCSRNLDMMQTYLEGVLEQNLPIEEKVDAYSIQVFNWTFVQNKPSDACRLALDVLAQLGVHICRKPTKRTNIWNFLKTKRLLKGFDTDKLCSLPVMADKTKLLAMQLLSQMQEIAYFSRPDLYPLIAMKTVQMSINKGISKFSSVALASYGIVLAGLGNINEAKRLADAAIALMKKFKAKDMEPKVLLGYYNCILFRKKPTFLMHKLHLDAYEIGLKLGDVNWAFNHLRASLGSALNAGKPLPLLEVQIHEAVKEMENYNQNNAIAFLRPLWQFVLNMMGQSSDPTVLIGNALQEEEYTKLNRDNVNGSLAVQLVKIFEFKAAFYFGDYELVSTLQKQLNTVGKTRQSTPIFIRTALFEGLLAFSLARTTKSKRRGKQAVNITSKVKAWVDDGDINFKNVLLMFQAEMAALNNDREKAHEKFKEAIAISSKYGLNHDRALANERFGEYLLETPGDKHLAIHHIILARQSYMRWGAYAKVKHLCQKHAALLSGVDFEKLDENDRRWSV